MRPRHSVVQSSITGRQFIPEELPGPAEPAAVVRRSGWISKSSSSMLRFSIRCCPMKPAMLLLGRERVPKRISSMATATRFWRGQQRLLLVGGMFDHGDDVGEGLAVDRRRALVETALHRSRCCRSAFAAPPAPRGCQSCGRFKRISMAATLVDVLLDELREGGEVILRLSRTCRTAPSSE